MLVSIFARVAISCGIVVFFSCVGRIFVSYWGLRRCPEPLKNATKEEDEEEEEEEKPVESETSPDAIHLIRLSNAFCPPGVEPSIFGYDLRTSGRKSSIYSDDDDNFSDVLEESSFCLRDSFEHGHTHRISIKPPAFVHQASTAEISTGDHKSASSARRSSTTFAADTHRENGSSPEHENGSTHKSSRYQQKNSYVSELNGAWGQLTSKRKKLFTVRPSINALRRLNQSKQVHQVEQPKLIAPARIDYMNTVRTRFKLISSRKLSLKSPGKEMSANHPEVRNSGINGARLSSVFFGSV